jgi:hypothetical protein
VVILINLSKIVEAFKRNKKEDISKDYGSNYNYPSTSKGISESLSAMEQIELYRMF